MNLNKLGEALLFFVPFLFSLSFHEAAHAYLAEKRGDPTARILGRVTINPIPHIDILGTIIFPLISIIWGGLFFGWAKPVPVNPLNLKNYKKDNLLISLAGPVSNLILAVIFALLIKISSVVYPNQIYSYFRGNSGIFDYPIITMLDLGIRLNITLALFNLIPIPPLDGSHILEGVLPNRFSSFFEQYKQIGFYVFMFLLLSGVLKYLSYPIGLIYISLLGVFL